jgi:lipoprotein-anchoring transpeptidase ErfK/SrfK
VSFRQLIQHRGIMGVASSAIAVLIAGATFAAISQGSGHEALASTANSQPGGAADGQPSGAAVAGANANPAAPARPVVPLRIVSVTPNDGTTQANGAAPIKVTFNEPVAANTHRPTLSPPTVGNWIISGDSIIFQPRVGYAPGTQVTMTVPGGANGVQAAGPDSTGTTTTAATGAGLLAKSATVSFTTGTYSVLRLQQLLTQLGYLPLTWTPADPATGTIPATNANAQLSAAYQPPAGSFAFRSGYPWQLTSQWRTGKATILVHGAVMAFEHDRGLAMDGQAGPVVWSRLLAAVARNEQNPNGYTYSLADQHSPETLRVWHNGKMIETTPVNTGVPGAGTQDGTFAVYLRYQVTIMKGTNVDGSKYTDTVHWVSYFHGGDALHYFPRPGYGYYQSNGCVEMQLTPAKYIWNFTTYGSLVTVAGPVA